MILPCMEPPRVDGLGGSYPARGLGARTFCNPSRDPFNWNAIELSGGLRTECPRRRLGALAAAPLPLVVGCEGSRQAVGPKIQRRAELHRLDAELSARCRTTLCRKQPRAARAASRGVSRGLSRRSSQGTPSLLRRRFSSQRSCCIG